MAFWRQDRFLLSTLMDFSVKHYNEWESSENKDSISLSLACCSPWHRPVGPGLWQILHTHFFELRWLGSDCLRANQLKPFLLWNNVFSLCHHFPRVGNFTWSIMTLLKPISPESHRATFGAAGHCTSVTPLWQSARYGCSICREWISNSVLFCVRIPKVEWRLNTEYAHA